MIYLKKNKKNTEFDFQYHCQHDGAVTISDGTYFMVMG